MSRTYRRKNQNYDYRWALRDFVRPAEPQSRFTLIAVDIPASSPEGRKRLAKYHSDHAFVLGEAPRNFRKSFKRSQRMGYRLDTTRWLKDSEYPVQCDPRTRHSATWAWW